jgi:hypothetical protein
MTITESAGAVTLTAADTQPLTTEQVQDIVGGMVTGNTETDIAVTYEDGDGTLDFVASNDNTTYSAGTDLDLSGTTFSLETALDSVVTMYNANLIIGSAASQEIVDFSTSNEVNTKINNTERLSVTASGVDVTGNLTVSGDTTVVNILAGAVSNTIQFEGSGDDGYETTVGVINPASADRTINFPDADGTVSLSDTNTTYSAGTLLDLSGTTFNVDLTEAGEAAMTVADDYVLFLDGGATGTHAKEKWADIATAIAGTNITASNGVLAAADTQPLTTEQVQDIVGGMVTGNTETNIAVTYEDGDGTLDFVSTDTVRTVTAGGNTLATGETLAFTAGTNMTITESGGAVTLAAPVRTVTAGGNTLAAGETLAFTAGSHMTITESGGAVTLTAANDNTTYSAGNGIALSSTTFSVAGNTGLDQDSDGLSIDATVCTLTGSQTLTNKTIDAGAYTT